MFKKISSIEIPNDPAYIGCVLAYSRELAVCVGFSEKEVCEIDIALSEACENVIQHAFDPHEDESFIVTFNVLSDGLKIVIDEMGLPFCALDAQKGRETPGLKAIHDNMDEVSFTNRGKKGKELTLCKYLKGKHVEELFSDFDLEPYESCPLPMDNTKYEFRLMKPQEAVDVSRCIYRAYKYTYLNEDLYFPERIEARNKDGTMISYVAITGSGEVVAHFAILPRPNKRSAEIGVAVVVPQHRKKRLMKTLLHYLIIEATERGFYALYGNAFTMHTLSQRTNLNFDFSETALQLGVFPPVSMRIMKDKGLMGAGNVLTFFKYLKTPQKYEIFPPGRHRDMIDAIYAGLGLKGICDNAVFDIIEPQRRESDIRLTIKPFHKTAGVEIRAVGLDLDKRIKTKRMELADKGFNAIYIDLNLSDPLVPWATAKLEEIGFFFAGVLPQFSLSDSLRLQYYITDVIYDEIETASDFAGGLKKYVKKLDPKYAALHA